MVKNSGRQEGIDSSVIPTLTSELLMSRPAYRLACLLTIGFGILLLNACSTNRVAIAPDVLKDLNPESQITMFTAIQNHLQFIEENEQYGELSCVCCCQ